jgi:succinate-semialdehyde dehydrogenase / glutarate-semialdehyde dehydrogenase
MSMTPRYGPLRLFVDGQWLERGSRIVQPVSDPGTGAVLGELPLADANDVAHAIQAADTAFESWRNVSAYDRSRIIEKAANLVRERSSTIASTLTREQGKPLRESLAEVLSAADTLEWHAEEGRRAYGRIIPPRRTGTRMLALTVPVGPVAAFSGWNAPAQTPARKIGGAIAAGCTIVLKASEATPATAISIAEAFADAGLPAGVLNLVFGDPGAIAAQMLRSDLIRMITFTGSTEIGRHLAAEAARGLKRTTMELGGHAPVIIFDDVDVDAVAEGAVAAKFRNSGQICTSPTRFYVHETVYPRFIDRFAEVTKHWRLGHGLDPDVQMGPCANEKRVESFHSFVADAEAHGARVLAGGRRIPGVGHFVTPTLLVDVPDDAAIMQHEPFGPIAVARPFSHMGEALALANRLPFGLAAYAFTRSLDRATALSEGIAAGNIALNNWVVSAPETPFGGIRDSGFGVEGGIEGLREFLVTKFVHQA